MKIEKQKKTLKRIILLAFFIAILIVIFCTTTFSYKEHAYKIIQVSDGETLWSIAKFEKENNEYYKNKDIREIVNEIKITNNLDSCNLKSGQELKI